MRLLWQSNEDISWVDRVQEFQSCGRIFNMVGVFAMMILRPKSSNLATINRGQLVDVMIIDQL